MTRYFMTVCLLYLLTLSSVAQAQQPDKSRLKDISFDTIKFDIAKGAPFKRDMLTKEISALEGQLVRIRGYMLPSFQQSGIKKFVLVRDNMECCFGPGAALYDCVIIEMQGSSSASFSVRPIAVEGVFKVSEFKGPDGKHLAIYHIDGRSAK
ncbi:MAG: hypothetical protein CMJ79_15390 [Planctomycetaceae bacterium]|nr:hypothetical protein [Planctomycetaceae bacterium]|tara:strand:+ start:21942 stop:22397 length:456 start_codon:yes stop_codon:yes gene_type:complete